MADSASYDYNFFQQLYCLNAVANAAGKATGNVEKLRKTIKSALDKKIPKLPGNWTVTWGPGIFKKDDKPGQGPDNACFVAQSGKTCVVAVAGTAIYSKEGIFIDIDVDNTVDYKKWLSLWNPQSGVPYAVAGHPIVDPTLPYLAAGTCIGVANVLNMTSTYASSNLLLWQYLKSLDAGMTVIFTGHSMGGALTPVIALALQQSKILTASNVSVLPSAGATPGNEPFVQLYEAAFAPTGTDYQGFNANFFNTNDVVPQAFSLLADDDRNFENIKKLYGSAQNWCSVYKKYVKPLKEKAAESGMAYRPLTGRPFSAEFNPPTWILPMQVFRQHAKMYWEHIGIDSFVTAFIQELKGGGVEVITEEDLEGVEYPGETQST